MGSVMHLDEVSDMKQYAMAAEWKVSEWLNVAQPLRLQQLRGRVVFASVFHMLCPDCVAHGLPQAVSIHRRFPARELVVLGLHSAVEHRAVLGTPVLRAFLKEFQIPFPVGVDQAAQGPGLPHTMQAYGLRGTASVLVIDRQGRLRLNYSGRAADLQIGALLGQLLSEPAPRAAPARRVATGA